MIKFIVQLVDFFEVVGESIVGTGEDKAVLDRYVVDCDGGDVGHMG